MRSSAARAGLDLRERRPVIRYGHRRKPQKTPVLLAKPAIRTSPNGSENGWQNQKRLAVRLAVPEAGYLADLIPTREPPVIGSMAARPPPTTCRFERRRRAEPHGQIVGLS